MNGLNHPAFTSQPQRITVLWPVLISRPIEGRRLSWPELHIEMVCLPEDGHPSRYQLTDWEKGPGVCTPPFLRIHDDTVVKSTRNASQSIKISLSLAIFFCLRVECWWQSLNRSSRVAVSAHAHWKYGQRVSAVADEPARRAASRTSCCQQKWTVSVINLRQQLALYGTDSRLLLTAKFKVTWHENWTKSKKSGTDKL